MSLRGWLPIVGLTCAAFIFNTSEFIPIGLLSGIAADFAMTEAQAGMLISVYAWIVTLLSLPLMLAVSGMEMRRLLLCTILLFIGFQLLSSVSAGYALLMCARVGVACCHAVFWSIVSPLAVRIVPEKCRPLALSMIVTGTSVAMIFGLPLGRIIGLHIGWRMTFLCVGLFAGATLACLAFLLPKIPARGRISLHSLPDLLGRPPLMGAYLLSFAVAASYYTGYSFIEPFLKQTAGMPDGHITGTLVLFGAAGILGSLSFSRYYAGNPRRFVGAAVWGIAACLLLLHPFSAFPPAVAALCAFWGMAVTAFNAALQAEVIDRAPQEARAVAMSVFSGIFNLGIGCGTLIGGEVCSHLSVSYVGYAGGVLAAAVLVFRAKPGLLPLRRAKG